MVEFFGVRHHSPAAARLVARRITDRPPAAVLIEGPTEGDGEHDQEAQHDDLGEEFFGSKGFQVFYPQIKIILSKIFKRF